MISQFFKNAIKGQSIARLVILLALVCGLSATAAADNPSQNSTQKTQAYCESILKSNIEKACSSAATKAVNVATYHCDSAKDQASCILAKAKSYIKDAANPAPSSANDFNKSLDKVLSNAGGDPSKPSATATTSNQDCTDGTCGDPAADPNSACSKGDCDFIKKYINPAINLLTLVFGIIAVGSIIMGGIQYSTSEGDPQKVAASKKRIVNTIVAVVAYFFLYAFLQFLIPGGLFGGGS